MSDESALPSSHRAEQALLGILIYDNNAIERIPSFFKASHMHDPVHAALAGAILEAVQGGRLANAVTLLERFGEDQAFIDMGGFGYLADLVDKAPAAAEATDFCHLISDLAVRRAGIQMADRLRQRMLSDRKTPSLDILGEAEKEIFDLAVMRQETGPRDMGDILGAALEMAAAAYNRDGALAGQPTGLSDLDKKLGGLRPGNLIVLAARPSMGKTALVTNIAVYNAKQYVEKILDDGTRVAGRGGVAAMFSLEMGAEELGLRILSDETGINGEHITTGRIDADDFYKLRDAAVELREIPLYIDATGAISLAAIATRARRLKRTVGLDILIIDYLQLVTTGDESMSPNERVTKVTQGLKALAKELGIPIIALSQLTRKVDERADHKPQLADLRESGAIEQDADVVAFVYREHYYLSREMPKEGTVEHMNWEERMEKVENEADIIIGKQRHGSIGTVKVSFKGETTRFSDLPREDRSNT